MAIKMAKTIDPRFEAIVTRVEQVMSTAKAGRGRPPSGKVRVTMLLDPDVIAKFKADGPGWQARINEALKR